jgi:tetratricopeptide (TPR) repeat protein
MARRDWPALAEGFLIAACAIAVYYSTFSVPLVFDDLPSIVNDLSIRHLGTFLRPSIYSTAVGRPLLSLSLAVNYAVSGTNVWSYHAVNLAIQILAALTLFGIVRRTLARRYGATASALAFSISLLWALHPLQTESVTYVIQRAESLMGLLYLLTLYCFIRGAETEGRIGTRWFALCVACCALGMAAKEVMASAPLVVLLYDRTFVAGSFREAMRRRRVVHAAMASTWLILFLLLASTHGRNGTAGFGSNVAWWRYALAQFPAIAHYLRLCFWPHPLILDYGTDLPGPSIRVLPPAFLVIGLLAVTIWAVARRPPAGFLGAAFFLILAPSSSIIPVITEPMAEHRMYLPLISVVAFVVLGIHRLLGRAALPLCLFLAACLGVATVRRNRDYVSEEAIWRDTIAKCPDNCRARVNLGNVLANDSGRLNDAIAQFEEALRLNPDFAVAHNDLGVVLARVPGRLGDAIAQCREALRLKPDYADAHFNLGNALSKAPGRLNDAIVQYREALRLRPDNAVAHYDLGIALAGLPGRLNDAIAEYQEALRLRPDYADAHNNLGNAWFRTPGRLNDAIAEYQEALRLRPGMADVHFNLGNALATVPERMNDAITQYREALRLKPDDATMHYNLGNAFSVIPGRLNDAVAQYREALGLKPDYVDAHYNLANTLANIPGRLNDAIAEYREALRLKPDYAEVHFSLAVALLNSPGHRDEAKAQLEEGLRLHPDDAQARQILDSIQAPIH